jgi:tetratricopeptide (TPR) repeat protein
MSEPSQPSGRGKDPDLTPRRGFSPIPRMPGLREPLLVLDEVQGETGTLLWHLLTDLETWSLGARERLFRPGEDAARLVESCPGPIRPSVEVIARIWWTPAAASARELADACAAMWEWAEQNELLEVALQFAERAARLQPTRSDRSSTAGRFCRLRSEPHRGTMWFRRALRIAQARKAYVEVAIAHLGLGNIESGLGRLHVAESHQRKAFKAALRAGKRSLAGSAYHDLLLLKIRMERYDEAWVHAKDALAAYKGDHPRFPLLAHDIALLWMHLGHFSAAHLVFERVLALLKRPSDRMVVLANVARSAAACGDRLRYERAVREIIRYLEDGGIVTLFTRFYLAQAARTAGDWKRAEYAAQKALEVAPEGEYRDRALRLIAEIAARLPGDEDVLPEEGGEIEQVREILLRRLEKKAAPGDDPGAVPPEQYPIT